MPDGTLMGLVAWVGAQLLRALADHLEARMSPPPPEDPYLIAARAEVEALLQ